MAPIGRVWLPVLGDIASAGLRPVAVDLPGFGSSEGELSVSEASVPRLSAWLLRFLEALGHKGQSRSQGTTSAEGWPSISCSRARGGGACGGGERYHVRLMAGSRSCSVQGSR